MQGGLAPYLISKHTFIGRDRRRLAIWNFQRQNDNADNRHFTVATPQQLG